MKECQHCKACYADDVNACPTDGMPTLHTIAGEPVLEGKYHLETRVGQGGMGVVYKARHQYLKTLHAIKIILPDLVGNDPQLVTRFRQEALAAAAIRHQNVVQVTDYGVAQGTMPFLVMEFVEGEDLNDFLEREKRLSIEDAFELTSAICKGIGGAHSQGIVHRDMKPLNIMIVSGKSDFSESVKILDFGLAKIKSGELLGSFIQAQTTGLMGSPFYMAPEQWSDEDLDGRSDIYSIGIMLYQMLTGDVPFKGSSIPAIMKKHLTDTPPSFAEKGVSDISPEIERVVMRTLEKDRDARFPNVETLIEELGNAVGVTSMHISGASQTNVPVSKLSVLTSPPKSHVYVDNVSFGESQVDGWITLDGLQSGNHLLKVSHSGFEDWESEVVCDGTPKQVVAELKAGAATDNIPKPTDATVAFNQSGQSIAPETPVNLSTTQQSTSMHQHTAPVDEQSEPGILQQDSPQRAWYLSPLVLAIIGISGLLLLTAIGGLGIYMSGIFESDPGKAEVTPTAASPEKSGQPTPITGTKAEMVEIPGGEFTMGRNDALPRERPEHKVTVETFWMDKTEVTNAEYYEFIEATKEKAPPHFVNGKPLVGKEMHPVNFVSLDDAKKFAEWRSERDGKEYRLPTEKEWEYAARNGSKNSIYPWGDSFAENRAVIGGMSDVRNVGGRESGANVWGVQDLIGNVWEWTDTPLKEYPNSPLVLTKANLQVIRGGSFFEASTGKAAITSTFRGYVDLKSKQSKDKALGFRLVRSDK
ncbi:MAG: SUMF1/EgtB/PvdO family nonheme iron enzyme [Pyrinomonadaceae bacterium]|nr:SUMF1/EgtB/PvdO family nonheme iron enzyme [Pyrinomonadaceae bacterium]